MSADSHNRSLSTFGETEAPKSAPFNQSQSQDGESHYALIGVTFTAGLVIALGICYICQQRK